MQGAMCCISTAAFMAGRCSLTSARPSISRAFDLEWRLHPPNSSRQALGHRNMLHRRCMRTEGGSKPSRVTCMPGPQP
eukprot:1765927-Amphidinium_carterae.1